MTCPACSQPFWALYHVPTAGYRCRQCALKVDPNRFTIDRTGEEDEPDEPVPADSTGLQRPYITRKKK